jgi:hypothetical protein
MVENKAYYLVSKVVLLMKDESHELSRIQCEYLVLGVGASGDIFPRDARGGGALLP